MDRRVFLGNSLAAAGGAIMSGRLMNAENAHGPQSEEAALSHVPGAIAQSEIEAARFPDDFLWGTATAVFQV